MSSEGRRGAGSAAGGEKQRAQAEAEPLGQDTGVRYDRSEVPTVGNVVCDRKRGSVRCGLSIHQDESLPEHKGEDDSESYVCHGPDRISLAVVGGRRPWRGRRGRPLSACGLIATGLVESPR